jgi:hypothetical protein
MFDFIRASTILLITFLILFFTGGILIISIILLSIVVADDIKKLRFIPTNATYLIFETQILRYQTYNSIYEFGHGQHTKYYKNAKYQTTDDNCKNIFINITYFANKKIINKNIVNKSCEYRENICKKYENKFINDSIIYYDKNDQYTYIIDNSPQYYVWIFLLMFIILFFTIFICVLIYLRYKLKKLYLEDLKNKNKKKEEHKIKNKDIFFKKSIKKMQKFHLNDLKINFR